MSNIFDSDSTGFLYDITGDSHEFAENDHSSEDLWRFQRKRNPNIPSRMGRFEIINQMGRGRQGAVYLGYDTDLSRKVVIKVPRADQTLPKFAANKFLNSAKLLAKVRDPSIVEIHDLGFDESTHTPFVVMQYVEGRTLRHFVRSHPVLNAKSIRILLDISQALSCVHQLGIVHRNFKPSNVILDDKDGVHVVNFGMTLHNDLVIAEFLEQMPTSMSQFLAPEQMQGEMRKVDRRTDVWSFGVTMHMLLSGKLPFSGSTRAEISKAVQFDIPVPLNTCANQIPDKISNICCRCLSKNMSERYSSMLEVATELHPELEKQLAAQRSPSVFPGSLTNIQRRSPTLQASKQDISESEEANAVQANASSRPSSLIDKGLAAYDEFDEQNFSGLLPGPQGLTGQPESIQFWLSRLNDKRPSDRVSTGIIYGPRGSGKTSFVRAGLIPKLDNVTPVYVDCSAPIAPSSLLMSKLAETGVTGTADDLAEFINTLSQKSRDKDNNKIVLVLDQFEHWLAIRDDYEQLDWVHAIAQCQCDTFQCLILVQEEFWAKLTKLMRFLEQPLEERRNTLSIPMLNPRQSQSFLKASLVERGFLPNDLSVTKNQEQFFSDLIRQVSEREQVPFLHLSFLLQSIDHETLKRPRLNQFFKPANFEANFITGLMQKNGNSFPPHLQFLLASILKELLTGHSTQSDSVSVSENKLRTVFETAAATNEIEVGEGTFVNCIGFLQSTVRLIELEDQCDPGKHFCIGCEFLNPSIEQWVSRTEEQFIQQRLAKHEKQKLSSIQSAYDIQSGSTLGKQEISKIRKPASALLYAMAALVFCVIPVCFVAWMSLLSISKDHANLQSVLKSPVNEYFAGLQSLEIAPAKFDRMLQIEKEKHDIDYSPELMLRIELGSFFLANNFEEVNRDAGHHLRNATELLNSDISAESQALFREVMKMAPDQCMAEFANQFHHSKDPVLRARLAVLVWEKNEFSFIRNLLEDATHPGEISALANAFEQLNTIQESDDLHIEDQPRKIKGFPAFCEFATRLTTLRSQHKLLMLFSMLEPVAVHPNDRREMKATIRSIAERRAAASLINSILHVQSQYQPNIRSSPRSSDDLHRLRRDREAFTRRFDFGKRPRRLVLIRGSDAVSGADTNSGSEKTKDFAISRVAVHHPIFREFTRQLDRQDSLLARLRILENDFKRDYRKSEWLATPITGLTYNDICRFMNWLSEENDLEPAYRLVSTSRDNPNTGHYEFVPGRTGFRLPTANEMDWVTRGSGGFCPHLSANRKNAIQKHDELEDVEPFVFPNQFGIYGVRPDFPELVHYRTNTAEENTDSPNEQYGLMIYDGQKTSLSTKDSSRANNILRQNADDPIAVSFRIAKGLKRRGPGKNGAHRSRPGSLR